MTRTLLDVHYPACQDPVCLGCYPDVRQAKPVRIPGPKRDADGLSADQRRTKAHRESIERGVHPATGLRLLEPVGEFTCRDCIHAKRVHNNNFKGWKCELHRLGLSHSATSDIRVGWPACTRFEEA